MSTTDIEKLYLRDLGRLMDEFDAYSNEDLLWLKVDGINNSAGNLFLHLCGNLQHFIGATLASSGYERQRDFEFNGKVTLDELRSEIDETRRVLVDYFSEVENSTLQDEYPLQPFGYPMTVSYFLIHLHGHLNYHLGQINYHRRILSKTSN